MQEKETKESVAAPFYVDEFRPDDAEGIVKLFCAVYGEAYPIRLFL